jgi:predicted transcriptional regulator
MTTETLSPASDVLSRRIAVGLTQRELAARAACSWSSIRLFDRGYLPAHSATLQRVYAVLEQLEGQEPAEAA